MYYLQDIVLKTNIWKGEKDRHAITKNLLKKMRSQVYNWDCDKNTYRNVYHAIETDEIEYINTILEYETWYKIIKQ